MWHDTFSIYLIVDYRVEGYGTALSVRRVQQCADCRSVLTIQPDERRLRREFVYLAVLLDAYSRRCIGWALGRPLEAELTLEALRRALARREVRPGLVHHSDRGVQYAAGDYTALLAQHGIVISMSRKASPNDNALAESFIKTLKYEEVYLFEYEDFAEAQQRIEKFIERVYNEKRLHSALAYRPPAEYEHLLAGSSRGGVAAR